MLGIQRGLAEAWWGGLAEALDLEIGIRYSVMDIKPAALPRVLLSQVSGHCEQQGRHLQG